MTELVTGLDLVRLQLLVAAGGRLPLTGRAPRSGHAIEIRINAEDPARGFTPAPGRLTRFRAPLGPGVRVDTFVEDGSVISPHYDSLIAKLIIRGKDRPEVLARARRALEQFIVEGVKTSIPLHRAILDDPRFIAGDFSTRFMETFNR